MCWRGADYEKYWLPKLHAVHDLASLHMCRQDPAQRWPVAKLLPKVREVEQDAALGAASDTIPCG